MKETAESLYEKLQNVWGCAPDEDDVVLALLQLLVVERDAALENNQLLQEVNRVNKDTLAHRSKQLGAQYTEMSLLKVEVARLRADIAWLSVEVCNQTGAPLAELVECMQVVDCHKPVVNRRMGNAKRRQFAAEALVAELKEYIVKSNAVRVRQSLAKLVDTLEEAHDRGLLARTFGAADLQEARELLGEEPGE